MKYHVEVGYACALHMLRCSAKENPAVSQSITEIFNTIGDDTGSVAVTVTNIVSQSHLGSSPEMPIIVVGDMVDVEISGFPCFKIS